MNPRLVLCALVTLAPCIAPPCPVWAQAPSANANDLSLEVAALDTLHALALKPDQIRALGDLAKGAADSTKREPAKASPAFRQALGELRAALLRGDEDKAANAREKIDTLMEKEEETEIHDDVTVTDIARERAAKAFKLLTAPQVAALVGSHPPADPVEVLTEGFKTVRGLMDKEREEARDQVADEVTSLVAGTDSDRAKGIKEKAIVLLDRAAYLPEAQYRRELGKLRQEAKSVIGEVDSLELLRHAAEQALAELLSNPRLPNVLKAPVVRPRTPPTK
jgi:hypothetical protein